MDWESFLRRELDELRDALWGIAQEADPKGRVSVEALRAVLSESAGRQVEFREAQIDAHNAELDAQNAELRKEIAAAKKARGLESSV